MIFVEYVMIFVAAAIPWLEVALVIPLGILRGHDPILVILLGFAGNLLTVLLLIKGFDSFRQWLAKRREQKEQKEQTPNKRFERGQKIMDKYGLPGLALLGPILLGTHIAAFIGMSLGGSKRRTTIWMTASLVVWCVIFGVGTMMGFSFFTDRVG